MNATQLMRMKMLFFIFTVVVILFSFNSVAFATISPEPDNINFLAWLFAPDPDYFPNQLQHLEELINEKLGGLGKVFMIFKDFWSTLGSSGTGIAFTIPDNYFFAGYKGLTVNALSQATSYIGLFRNVFSAFVSILTAIFCYKKVVSFFK